MAKLVFGVPKDGKRYFNSIFIPPTVTIVPSNYGSVNAAKILANIAEWNIGTVPTVTANSGFFIKAGNPVWSPSANGSNNVITLTKGTGNPTGVALQFPIVPKYIDISGYLRFMSAGWTNNFPNFEISVDVGGANYLLCRVNGSHTGSNNYLWCAYCPTSVSTRYTVSAGRTNCSSTAGINSTTFSVKKAAVKGVPANVCNQECVVYLSSPNTGTNTASIRSLIFYFQ